MVKPRLLIIIRHAQSEGNRDKAIHQSTPDHKVGLTEEGHQQAREAGAKLRALLREDDTLHFFISPYRRTRQTTEGILSTLCSNEPAPSPFQRHHIKVYEEPRLREQDFGNFQPGTEEVERLWRERATYGHFFYRIPNGESGADVYDRVSSFNGSLWRRFNEDHMASVAVLVTHGLCSRVFLMAWYHYSVEFFEDLRNINHCEFLVMKLGKNGKYTLQNQLRRWTDLKRERAARKSISAASPPAHIPVRRWGSLAESNPGPPKTHEPVRQNTADLFKDDDENAEKHPTSASPSKHKSISLMISDDPEGSTDHKLNQRPVPDLDQSNKSLLSYSLQQLAANNDMSSRLSTKAYLGRDGGGSRSGAASPFEGSSEEEEAAGARAAAASQPGRVVPVATNSASTPSASLPVTAKPRSMAWALRGDLDEPGRVLADALGDHSEPEIDQADEELGMREREKQEMAHILAQEVRERTHGGDLY